MIEPRRRLRTDDPLLLAGFERIRTEFSVPDAFSDDVLAAADAAVLAFASGTVAPERPPRADRRDLPFVTVDPAGSRDLDQAFHAARGANGGFVVHYAIADVAAFVRAGDPVDLEARRRGATTYLPDRRAPLYPEVIGEGAASLLPDGDRPALLWTIELDAAGKRKHARVERATVRSTAARAYPEVQADIDAGTATESLALLEEIGKLRIGREIARGGVSIELSEQEVVKTGDTVELVERASLPVERWNAQISLLTGIAAAAIMVEHGVGLLRTMPAPLQVELDRLRHAAHVLRIPWPKDASYADVVRSVDGASEHGTAFLMQAVQAMRGASYETLGPSNPPEPQAAVAAPYAHVTAPLRRYADRFVNEIVLAQCSGTTPPPWSTDVLPALPKVMDAAARREHTVDRAVVDLLEAVLLAPRVGESFAASVVDRRDDHRAVVQIADPPVQATVAVGDQPLGADLTLRLDSVDPATRTVTFSVTGPADAPRREPGRASE